MNKEQKTEYLRHSLAHLLAAAVMELWPDALRTIGPAVNNGFYYDFDFSGNADLRGIDANERGRGISDKDLTRIEERMRALVKKWNKFSHREVSMDEAREVFAGNPYKLELIDEIEKKGEKITLYKSGSFEDLCRGGHVESAKEMQASGYKLSHLAGAYWCGDEKNKMLTRIYGLAFPTKEELVAYETMLEEAKKRDHRKLGKELEIFTFADEIGAGLPLWLPNGAIIRHELEEWARKTELKWGYKHIVTPHITKKNLFEISGHLPFYKNDLYSPIDIEGEEYYLRPMNCPFAHMVYKSKNRSYRDLTLRLAEYGQVYRFERSGTLHGLMRARGFCQNDAHIYVKPEDAVKEFVDVFKMHEYYYKTLGISDWWVVLGVRDAGNLRVKYHGDDEMWEKAEKLTRQAIEKAGVKYTVEEGGAAHYGPKADIYISSVIGKEYAIGTVQLDLYMPNRFDLKYIDKDGEGKMPYVIHRAPLGSHERMIGFLLEHFAGAFPFWLSPVQVRVLPITDTQKKYAGEITDALLEASFRAELDDASESLGKKIRDTKVQKIPYFLVIGDEELRNGTVMLESRDGKIGAKSLDELLTYFKKIEQEKK